MYQALLSLASTQLGVPVANLTVKDGVITGGGKSVTYGQLVSNQELSLTIPVAGSLKGLFGLSVHGQSAREADQPVQGGRPVDRRCGRSRRSSPARRPTSATCGCPGCSMPGSCIRPALGANAASRSARSTRSSSRTRRSSSRGTSSPWSTRSSTTAIETASLLARTTKWSDWAGLPGSGNLFGGAAQGRLDDGPRRSGVNVGNADAAFAERGDEALGDLRVPDREARTDRADLLLSPTCRSDGTVYVHVHSAEPVGDALGDRDDAQHVDSTRSSCASTTARATTAARTAAAPAPRTRR